VLLQVFRDRPQQFGPLVRVWSARHDLTVPIGTTT
jgi:hypothetical protein